MSDHNGLDRDLVCIDLETTGGSPAWHRIIEIGTVEIDRDGTRREWSTLVNPGVRVPESIETFTGISSAMVAEAPPFEAVQRELRQRLAGRLFIAHNAAFDYGFVRTELARLEIAWSTRPLCTVKLSRRLYPQQTHHNLDALIARHALPCSSRHRALGDARALAELLACWGREIPPARLAATVDALLRAAPLPAQLPPELADDLPEAPGVYRFHGAGEALLYVGRSRSIRTGVLEHFATPYRSGASERLAAEVKRITWTETTGELGALLVETAAIKREQPLHNRRSRRGTATWTLRLAPVAGAAARLAAVEFDALELEQQQEVYGLFRDPRTALRAAQEIARAHQLCAKVLGLEPTGAADSGSCLAHQLGRCRGACVGREPAALHDTRVRLALASQRLKPWPYRGRIVVAERNWRGEENLHVLSGWRYLGSVRERDHARSLAADAARFDPDVYRILKRFLAAPRGAEILELD